MTKARRVKDLKQLNNIKSFITRSRGKSRKEIGIFSEEPHPKKAGTSGELSFRELAMILIRGTDDGRIPKRPFVHVASKLAENELRRARRKLGRRIRLDEGFTVDDFTNELAEIQMKYLQLVFRQSRLLFAPNAPSTVEQKGHNKPLVETGALWNKLEIR